MKKALIRLLSCLLAAAVLLTVAPAMPVSAAPADVEEIENAYIRVSVSRKNGGYVIATVEGDILKKTDNDVDLTHRGANMDTSFTSFRIGGRDYIFGNDYTGSTSVETTVDPAGEWVTSTWSVAGYTVVQRITLVDSEASEQLGTAMITYTVTNGSGQAADVKSRVLIDTQLGDKDYGYYEIPKQNLGQGYEFFEFEQTWDSKSDPTIRMPADYFVRDNPYSSAIVGFGVNSVFADDKPYKMTFAHWANIASTRFDYDPDRSLNFTNSVSGQRTADSAVALYYDLGSIAPGGEKSFSTYYGVTANLKNKDNQIIINTTAPSKLEFKDDSRTAYAGSEGMDNIVRINTTITNPKDGGKTYSNLAVVVYALGFSTQRQMDNGSWIPYDNTDPVFTDVINLAAGQNRVTYFDFKFTPADNAQLGSFVTKVFDMDESVNELGAYAEEYCLATTENYIILPGIDPALPDITLNTLAPQISYNDGTRYLTVTGQGVSFFKSDLLNAIQLRGDNGKIYELGQDSLIYDTQTLTPTAVTIQLEEYMEPGRYQLHFVWKKDADHQALQGVPDDLTSAAMVVQMSSDSVYRNDKYGVVTIQRVKDTKDKYTIVPYQDESAFAAADVPEKSLLLVFRGEIIQDKANDKLYRMVGKDRDINISHMLNYHGSDLTIREYSDGTVAARMDGKLTTVGANTTVRDGTALFQLDGGTEYVFPIYNPRGEIVKNASPRSGQDFIELRWDNAFDTLRTIGGFLIDLKYGVLGKILEEDASGDEIDKTPSYDVISFGGGLDLGFMTPGGAAQARQNKKGGDKWTTQSVVDESSDSDVDTDPDGFGFGLDFDDTTGEIKTVGMKEEDVPPKNKKPSRVEAGVTIHDILFGGEDPDYVGINMDAHLSLPQIVSFLPNKIAGDLHINTIGGYEVGFDAKVRTAMLEMDLSLVIKSNPSGAPIPDKLYFTIGGFEPGINVDSLGVVWITGGGGGFDKLYETIYGKDGIPPITLLLNVQFDITKILTGSADLELSLRSISIRLDDVSLKKVENAKFIDGGLIAIGWYPNFSLNLQAGVNFLEIFKGSFRISASAGGSDTKDFVEFALRVALGVPKYIPIVGGMEIASAELGGGSEKVWGNVTLLQLIKVGFIYYWGGNVEFTSGNASGTESFSALSAGEARSMARFSAMTEPLPVDTDPETGETQYVAVGANLRFVAGSKSVSDYDQQVANALAPAAFAPRALTPPRIISSNERDSHMVQLTDAGDYILTVSPVGRTLSDQELEAELKEALSVSQGQTDYPLNYYAAPSTEGREATDKEKEDALKNANMNVAGGTAYIIIPKGHVANGKTFILDFSNHLAYDVGAICVDPVGRLTSQSAALNDHALTVEWTGEDLSDTAEIIISISDIQGEDGVILNDAVIKANSAPGRAVVTVPDRMASGEYWVTVTLSDEGSCFEKHVLEQKITVVNASAPAAPDAVTVENIGNDKLRVTVAGPQGDFDGYFIDVYEGDTLAEAGLFFEKGEEIIIGGRYEMPVMDETGKLLEGQTRAIGYTPGKVYTVKVRTGTVYDPDATAEDPKPLADGNEIYHCSAYITSQGIALEESKPPVITMAYDAKTGVATVSADAAVTGELYVNGGTEDGAWYAFTTEGRTLTQVLNLPDGEHSLEFHGANAAGDSAIVSQVISVDTTPPALQMEAPLSGDILDLDKNGGRLRIRALAEAEADYVFKANGKTVAAKKGGEIISGGLMDYLLDMGTVPAAAGITLEIQATDPAGNTSATVIQLVDARAASISQVALYNGDAPVAGGQITFSDLGDTAHLRLVGILDGGETMDLTDSGAAGFTILNGNSATLESNVATATAEGQTLIRATYDLGGGRFLDDGVVLALGDTDTRHIITATAGTGGTISPGGSVTVADGASQNFTITASSGYQVKDVLVDGVSAGPVTTYTFSNVVTNHTIAATFASINGPGPVGPGGDTGTAKPEQDGKTDVYGYTVTTPAGKAPVTDQKTGLVTLPGGGTIALPGGAVVSAPVNTSIAKDGLITIGNGNGAITLPSGAVVTAPSGSTITATGTVTPPAGKGVAVTTPAGLNLSLRSDTALTLNKNAALGYTVVFTNPFGDVSPERWYYNDVAFAWVHGLFNGTGNGVFSPDMSMTRGMLVTVLGRLHGIDPADYSGGGFTDVDEGQYYAPYAQWARSAGIVNGVGGGLFAPAASISRQDLAVILYRYIGLTGINLPVIREYTGFADSGAVAPYAAEAVEALYCGGIINGKPDNIFDPAGASTRAEIAAMLHRFITTVTK